MRALFSAVVLTSGVAFIGCASDGAIEREMSRVRREMHGLKKELQNQRLEIERLEGRVTLLSLGGQAPPRAEPTAPTRSMAPAPSTRSSTARNKRSRSVGSVGQPSKPSVARASTSVRPQRGPGRVLPVVRMSGRAEPGAEPSDPFLDPGAQDDGSPPVIIKIGPSPNPTGDRLLVDHDVLKRPDPNVVRKSATPKRAREPKKPRSRATRAEIREKYDSALASLRDHKDARAALAQFEAFLEEHSRSRLADNALYWSGASHQVLLQHDEAVKVFASLLRSHPRSAKVPYAKVGLGVSQYELGEHDAGTTLLREVIAKYPTSGAAREAESFLQAHGGN